MNNLLSYCGLVDVRINASEKDFTCTLVFSQLMYLVFWYEMMLLSEHMIGGARSVRSLTVMVYRNHLL